MDHSFSINSANELRLRRHIREVLLPYARIHLTSDHVAFTEKVVEELLLHSLEYVPMADATSFFLPIDPFELLIRSLDSLDLTPPEEKWATPSSHVTYLRTFFPPLDSHDLQTEKCWREEGHHVKLSLICRPVSSPILSERAMRETPKPGGTAYRASIPCSNSGLIAYLSLDKVSVQSMEDVSTSPADDILDLRYKLDQATAARARPLFQSILAPPTTEKFVDCLEDTPNVPRFLNHESPPRRLSSLYSPPLFPRVPRGFSTHRAIGDSMNRGINDPTRFPDLVSMLQDVSPELIESEDGDINSHHMKVVGGWSTLTFSSPPPRSLCSSDGSEVDELWNISPLGTPATSLMAAKLDEVEIPRTRKFGYKNASVDGHANYNGNTDLLSVTKSPGFFITSFISAPVPMAQTPMLITPQLGGVKPGMHSPHPLSSGQDTSDSLLVQPPSIYGERVDEKALASSANLLRDPGVQQFDDAVASIYVSTPQDPLCCIREEKLDEKDVALMDVPNLPPPTTHPREPIFFPKGMHTFVTPISESGRLSAVSSGSYGPDFTSFLRPVKGIKPLALDLSWRPFDFGKTIPTDEDVADIVKYIQPEDEVPGYCDEKYERRVRTLLDLGIPPASADAQPTLIPDIPRGSKVFGASPARERREENGTMYLLTHRERLRASCAKNLLIDTEAQAQDDADTERIVPCPQNDGREDIPHQDAAGECKGTQNSFDAAEYRSQGHGHPFGSSGTDNITSQLSTIELPAPHLLLSPHRDDSICNVNILQGDKENIGNQSEDKENVLPCDVSECRSGGDQSDPLSKQYDWSYYFQFPESEAPSFEPLSFASQSQPLVDLANPQAPPPPVSSGHRVQCPESEFVSTLGHKQTNPRPAKRRKLDELVPASSKDLFSTFIKLRNRATSSTLQRSETRNDTPTPYQTPDVPEQIGPRAAPDDLFNQHTVRLPEHWIPAAAVHRYLVSMNVIQKRALVRELQSHHCRVTLVERYDLGGIDIIVDLDYGVLFVPLLALPATIESIVGRISGESWRFTNLLVVFEAFPSSQSHRADYSQLTGSTPYPYTSPICKAIKKLRRNIGIAEGCGTMNACCTVTWAFADGVEEAARFARCFGEEACAMSAEQGYGVPWDDREWLEEEEREGESVLASVHGMNAFAAFAMLYDRPLDAILDLSREARLAEFGPLLGEERIIGLNAVIES